MFVNDNGFGAIGRGGRRAAFMNRTQAHRNMYARWQGVAQARTPVNQAGMYGTVKTAPVRQPDPAHFQKRAASVPANQGSSNLAQFQKQAQYYSRFNRRQR